MRKIKKISCASPSKDIAQNVSLFEIGYICKINLGNTCYMLDNLRMCGPIAFKLVIRIIQHMILKK